MGYRLGSTTAKVNTSFGRSWNTNINKLGLYPTTTTKFVATCDVICSLWQEEEDRELGIINMGMQKNRFGPNFGNGAFKCNYNTLTLKETNKDYFEPDDSSVDVVNNANNTLNKLSND